MEQEQQNKLNNYLRYIRNNTNKLLETPIDTKIIYSNIINRGTKIFLNKQITLQDVIDISSLGLVLMLNITEPKKEDNPQ